MVGSVEATASMPTEKKTRVPINIAVKGADIVVAYTDTFLGKPRYHADSYPNYYAISRTSGLSSVLDGQTGNNGDFRPCTHNTKRYLANPVSESLCIWDPRAWLTTFRTPMTFSGLPKYCHQMTYGQYLSAIGAVSQPLDSLNWSNLAQTALDAMMPSFGGQNSLVNFVLELKDFKKLYLSMTSEFVSKLNVLRAALGFNHWDKPMAKLAKTHLSYSFAWRPLFADLVKMVDTLSNFNAKLKTYVKEANTDLQKHFRMTVTGTGASASQYFYSGDIMSPGNNGASAAAGRTRVRLSDAKDVVFNATLRYRYPLPEELLSASGKAKAFLDALGVQANPAILWNAIPFSFIIDWVVNVSGWLNKLRTENIRFKTEIRDFCYSASFTRSVSYTTQTILFGLTNNSNVKTATWSDEQITDMCLIRSYRRKVGIPNFLSAMQTSGLDWREFSLAGALARANRR